MSMLCLHIYQIPTEAIINVGQRAADKVQCEMDYPLPPQQTAKLSEIVFIVKTC